MAKRDFPPAEKPGSKTKQGHANNRRLLAATQATCRFYGRDYNEGDKICWGSEEFVCQANGAWSKTGNAC